jgi:hypothetical protein
MGCGIKIQNKSLGAEFQESSTGSDQDRVRHFTLFWISSLQCQPSPFLRRSILTVVTQNLSKYYALCCISIWPGVISATWSPQTKVPPLVGCPRMLINCIHSCPPYLEANFSIRKLRTLRAVVTTDPFKVHLWKKKVEFSSLGITS